MQAVNDMDNALFHFLDYSFAETKDWDKRVKFGLSPEFRLTNHRSAHHCSLHNVIADFIAAYLCISLINYELAKRFSFIKT